MIKEVSAKKLQEELILYRDISSRDAEPDYHTYIAYLPDSPEQLVLKEVDRKRAEIYDQLGSLYHPNIANIYAVFCIPEEDRYLVAAEFAFGQTLAEYIKENGPLPEKQALFLCADLCDALKDLHKHRIIHRDIKPENIIIRTDKLSKRGCPQTKLIDFGIAEVYRPEREFATEFGGTRGYRAPETIEHRVVPQSDLYSLGCVLNFLLTGKDPTLTRYQGNYHIEEILEKALRSDYQQRYASAEAMQKILLHEAGCCLWDRIPFFRRLPGYRTHTPWKMLLASAWYSFQIDLISQEFRNQKYLMGVYLIILIAVLPLVIAFNLGGWTRILPRSIRRSPSRLTILKTALIILCGSIALAITYIIY